MDNSRFCFRINTPKVTNETIDGEVVIINFESGAYYSVDKAGADIWGFIEKNATIGKIVEKMRSRYEDRSADIENAVTQFIEELRQEDLIVPDQERETESGKALEMQVETRPGPENLRFEVPILHKYDDMQDLLLLDPIHEVDEAGWPVSKPDPSDQKEA